MFITPSITINDYVVVALSLRFGETELLDFTPKDPRLRYLPAIMDSWTSCIVIPANDMSGLLKEVSTEPTSSCMCNGHLHVGELGIEPTS